MYDIFINTEIDISMHMYKATEVVYHCTLSELNNRIIRVWNVH